MCMEDTIHFAVKLKARLMKTSIILPRLWKFCLWDPSSLNCKAGLWENNNYFDAVTHIVSISTMQILETIPDAIGTQLFLNMYVVNSYLDKKSSPLHAVH